MLSTFTTLDYLYSEIRAGKSKKWELQPVTLIAEVEYKDAEMLSLKTDNLDLICGVRTIAELDLSDYLSYLSSSPFKKLKCQRLFRPKISKVKPSFVFEIL